MRTWATALAIAVALVACGDDGGSIVRPSTTDATDGSSSGGTDPSTSTTADSGCVDECMGPFLQCDGDDLVSCTFGGLCYVEVRSTCPMGCNLGACVGEICGDGMLGAGEDCDDGNENPGDGCSAMCQAEQGWVCDDSSPSVCSAPNLLVRIDDIDVDPGSIEVTYTVSNVGRGDIEDYRVDLWAARPGRFADPPILGEEGELVVDNHPPLASGASQTFFERINGVPSGSNVAFAVVDTLGEVPEVDDNDNVALGFAWTDEQMATYSTRSSQSGPVAIPGDGTMVFAEVDSNVQPFDDLYASVNITHPALDQLTLRVVASNGATLELMSSVSGQNLQSTTFGEGFGSLAGATAPYVGAFAPVSDWTGTPEGGVFRLEVEDAGGMPGTLNAFSVTRLQP